MKHAYLIIAHNEFGVLQRLVNALDDEYNDIYIHYDSKVKFIPKIFTKYSSLYVIDDRINTCWGDISLLNVEYKLWESAYNRQEYRYYHLISGQHFPLKSPQLIREYFNNQTNKNIFQFMPTEDDEINAKIRRYNFFSNFMMSGKCKYSYSIGRFLWNLTLKPQKLLNIKRYKEQVFYKSSQWCSLTHEAVQYMIGIKNRVMKTYRYSFCADEFFVLSELMNSPLKRTIVNNEYLLKADFYLTHPRVYIDVDFNELIDSNCFFARKFTNDSLSLIERIEQELL